MDIFCNMFQTIENLKSKISKEIEKPARKGKLKPKQEAGLVEVNVQMAAFVQDDSSSVYSHAQSKVGHSLTKKTNLSPEYTLMISFTS